MTFATERDQTNFDALVDVAEKNMEGMQRALQSIVRMKQSPAPAGVTVQKLLDDLASLERAKKEYGQNFYAACRTAHSLWPNRKDVGKEVQLAAQLRIDRRS